jgi:hypothetical protein
LRFFVCLFHKQMQRVRKFRTLRILGEDFFRFQGPSENDMEREGASTRGCGNNWWRSQEKTSKERIRVVVVEKNMTVHLNSIQQYKTNFSEF